jgi:peptidyl-prolyl cis-trans isomerase A (cyclophilin A)
MKTCPLLARRRFLHCLAWGATTLAPRAGLAAETLPRVALETSLGRFVVEVDTRRAPLSAADFLRYVDRGLYAGASFYRNVRHDNDRGSPGIEVIQGGLLDDTRRLPPVAHEGTAQTGLRHLDGTLSLARGAVGTGSAAAFFVCLGDQPGLDQDAARNPDRQGFAAFGRVVEGMDVVRRIHAAPTDAERGEPYVRGQLLREPVRIDRAVRLN